MSTKKKGARDPKLVKWRESCPIRVGREAKKWTREKFAVEMFTTVMTVSYWETGVRQPYGVERVERIGKVLGIEPAKFSANYDKWWAARPSMAPSLGRDGRRVIINKAS